MVYSYKDRVLSRMVEKRFCRKTDLMPIGVRSWSLFDEFDTVLKYRQIMVGMFDYYSSCDSKRILYRVEYLLRYSCAKTIATRKKITMSQVFKRYGNSLEVIRTIKTTKGSKSQTTYFPSVKDIFDARVKKGTLLANPDKKHFFFKTIKRSETDVDPFRLSDDGTKLFVIEHSNDTITTHNLGTAYDISTQTSSLTDITLASNPHTSAYGIEFSTDGTKMFTSDISTGYVYQWTLTTPWDRSIRAQLV